MKAQTITLHEDRHVTLTCYLQEVGGEFQGIPKRPAVIVLPGGGYEYCSPREADPVAFPYLKAGCQVFILRYSVGDHAVWPAPLNDYEEAIALIREKSDEWNVWPDKIAVIGFSAGGHLAAAAATMAKNRPNAAILGYPAVEKFEVRGCPVPDTTKEIDDLTPPCFLFHTRTDGIVPVSNSISFIRSLEEHNISFESHIYSYGPHGFSTGDSSVQSADTRITPRARNWVADSIGWLAEVFGEFENGKMGEPKVKSHIHDDNLPFLTLDCTMGHIMESEGGQALMRHLMASMPGAESAPQDFDHTEIIKGFYHCTLREVLGLAGLPKDAAEALDAQLRQIKTK